jgi:hypothetical protein
MNGRPKGVYLVAVVFFFGGLVCIGELLRVIFYALGFERGRGLMFQSGYLWVVLCGLLLFWLLCYAVVALARLRYGARWAFFGMTLFLIFRFLMAPAANFHCVLLVLPSIGCCIYLWRLRLIKAE